MRWFGFIALQGMIFLVIAGIFHLHQDHVIVLKEAPASLAQWYKPQNKRQVWLHTMFELRREMLALEIYSKEQDAERLQKWADKLEKDYSKIAEMAPEWSRRLDLASLAEIQKSISEKRYSDVANASSELAKSCESCHADYRVEVATRYRAPDFSKLKIDGSTTLVAHMSALSDQVNQIKIAFVDDRKDAALSALADLGQGMNRLGELCGSCHNDRSPDYPNAEMKQSLATLEQSLQIGTLQEQGEALGTLAVLACAQCHGTHRLSYDAKKLLGEKKSWRELLKHSF